MTGWRTKSYPFRQNCLNLRRITGDRRGMLTLEAAILTPLVLMMALIITGVMLYAFQGVRLASGLHQYGITETRKIHTDRLVLRNPVRGGVIMAESLSITVDSELSFRGPAGLQALSLAAELKISGGALDLLKPVRVRSLHLRMPASMMVYALYGLKGNDDGMPYKSSEGPFP